MIFVGKGDAKATGDNNVRPLELTRGALRVVFLLESVMLMNYGLNDICVSGVECK